MLQNDAITPAVRSDIERRLAAVEAKEGVRLLLTIESGSRAWGFPSPDSDYDVRFIYVRPRDWYLSLTPGRDVIEAPIVDDVGVSGWDIRKALDLFLEVERRGQRMDRKSDPLPRRRQGRWRSRGAGR